jgi:hypothetical protein
VDSQGSHVHTGSKNIWTADTGGQNFGGSNFAIRQYGLSDIMNADGLHSHTVTINSNTTGITNVANATGFTVNTYGTGASANIPPAIILNYIIKT